jgi:hypothetical protein
VVDRSAGAPTVDLATRGLLDETMVGAVGGFGWSPESVRRR